MASQLPIADGFYVSDSRTIAAKECLNLYPNIVQTAALSQETLFGTPGLVQKSTTGPNLTDANRGSELLVDNPYFVNGNTIFKVNADFTTTTIGTIEGTGRVSMAVNSAQQLMVLVPGGKGYIVTQSPDAIVEITAPGFTANGAPQFVVFVDGFFAATTDDGKFILSGINDGTAWNALDFGTAESSPDAVVVPVVSSNQLFIAGTNTIEAFSNIGGAGFPFQRTGLFLNKGVFAPSSVAITAQTFMFIGGAMDESPAIWQLSGNSLAKVSTTAEDVILQKLTQQELSDVFAWSYAQNGAYFVGFNLPDTCLVFDSITSRWHERKSRVTNPDGTTSLIRNRVNSIVTAFGVVLVGDSQDGRIGEMDIDFLDEYGVSLSRVVSTQAFINNLNPFQVSYIELKMQAGVGDATTPDPQVRMDISRDGFAYDPERSRPMGKVGETKRRQIWRRSGNFNQLSVLRFTITDPVKIVIIGLYADFVGVAA